MKMEIVMDLQVLYNQDRKKHTTDVDQFKLWDRVAGESNENLQYILDTTAVEMNVQTQPTGIHDGLQFTLQHADINGLEKAEGLLFMLLIQIKTDFEEYMYSLQASDAVKLQYNNSRAICGVCGKSRSSSMEDFIKHVKFHDTNGTDAEDSMKTDATNDSDLRSCYYPLEPNNNKDPKDVRRERSCSPSGRKRRRSRSKSQPRKHSRSPIDWSKSSSPPKRPKMSPMPSKSHLSAHNKTSNIKDRERKSYSPQHRDRSRSKSGSGLVKSYSPPTDRRSSHESRTTGTKQDRTPNKAAAHGKEDMRETPWGKSVSPQPRAVRDLLEQGLRPRPDRYSAVTDEMILYPHTSEPLFVAEVRKFILLRGRADDFLSNKNAQTIWWMLTFKALTPTEKELVEEEVTKTKHTVKGASHSQKLTLQLEVVCDFLINRCKFWQGRVFKEPYPYQHLLNNEDSEKLRQHITNDLLALKDDTFKEQVTNYDILNPDPGQFDERFGEISDSMIENAHPAEPEFVALGRRYFLLLDRRDGRLKDVKTSKIIEKLKSKLSAIEEKKITDMCRDSYRQSGDSSFVIPKEQSLTTCLVHLCDYLVAKARLNTDTSRYPYLKQRRTSKDRRSTENKQARTWPSDEEKTHEKEQIERLKKGEMETFAPENFTEEWDISRNGQYGLNVAAKNVNVQALIWVDCLREQNQIQAVYSVAPWTDRTITLHLGDETHTADAKGDKTSPKQLRIQLKQQVALEALMNTLYCFTKIPPSLRNYLSENRMKRQETVQVCTNEDGEVLPVESSGVRSPDDVSEEVTSTVINESAPNTDDLPVMNESPPKTSEVIQSSYVSQSTIDSEFLSESADSDIGTHSTTMVENVNASVQNEDAEEESGAETVIIMRNEFETKAQKYLKELQDSETDEQTENAKRLAELENTLTENDKIKILKSVENTMERLKEEVQWQEVPADAVISAKLEVTCKYILQKGTARQLAAAARQKTSAKRAAQKPKLPAKGVAKSKTVAAHSKEANRDTKTITKPKLTAAKTTSAESTSKAVLSRTKSPGQKVQREKQTSPDYQLNDRQMTLIWRAEEYIKQQEEGQLTEMQEAKNFDVLYNDLQKYERDIVDKKVDKELAAIKAEMGYPKVPINVRRGAQLEVVCRYILDEMHKNARPNTNKPKQSACHIDLPWISELEPETSKNKSMSERLTLLEKHVRLNVETRKEGIMDDVETKDKIRKIIQDMMIDHQEVNKRLCVFMNKYSKKKHVKCPPNERITAHFRITCEYVLEKFRDAIENPELMWRRAMMSSIVKQ